MAGAYDGNKKPIADKDPLKEIQWQIQKYVGDIWTRIIDFIQNAIDAVREWSTNLFDAIFGALVGLDTQGVIDLLISNPLLFIPTMITRLITHGLLGPHSPLNALNIFGLLQSFNIPFLPLAHLTNSDGPNLLTESGFDALDALGDGGVGWSRDPSQGHTKPGCAAYNGSALGSARQVESVFPIQVKTDDKLKVEGWLKWMGITYTGTTPLSVGVNKYLNNVLVGYDAIIAPTSPATNQSFWINSSATYTVPAGVDMVKLVLRVDGGVTAGAFYFDDLSLSKLGTSLPQQWINGLVAALDSIRTWIQSVIDTITGVVGDSLEGLGDFIATITGDIGTLFGNLGTLAYNLLHDAASVIGAIPQSLVTGLSGALTAVNNLIQQVIEGVILAIRGIPFVGAGIADMIATLTGYKKDVKDVQVATKNFAMSASSVARQPGWVSDYSLSASTYPAILNSQWSVFADTVGPATAGTAHSHAIRGNGADGDNARAVASYWGYGPGRSVGGFVTPTDDMVFSGFSFTCYSSATPVAGDFFFEVFRVNPDGSMVQLVSSDVSTFITTSDSTIDNVYNTFRAVAARGEKHLLRLRNASASKTINVLGLEWRQGAPDIQWETSGANTTKTSYTSAEHDTISGNSVMVAWMQLKADDSDVPEAFTWTDDFERPSLGYFWNQSLDDTGGDLVITNGSMAYGGTTNGYQQALYIKATATDQWRCDVNLVSIAGTGFTNIIVGSNRESTTHMDLSVGLNSVRLITVINGVTATRATVSRGSNDGKWSITYNKTTKVYTGYFNDVAVPGLTWTDSGNAMPIGRLYRYGQMQLQRASGVNSGVVRDWQLTDWTP